jgi:hypothetical protein
MKMGNCSMIPLQPSSLIPSPKFVSSIQLSTTLRKSSEVTIDSLIALEEDFNEVDVKREERMTYSKMER